MSKSEYIREDNTAIDYWKVFQELPVACVLFRANDPEFTIVELNHAWELQIKVARKQRIGRPFFEVVKSAGEYHYQTDQEVMIEAVRAAIKTGEKQQLDLVRYEQQSQTSKGSPKYWRRTYVPLKDKVGTVTHVVAVTWDVTEERGKERRNAEAQDRLQTALAIGKVGSWVLDVESDEISIDVIMAKLVGLPPHVAGKSMASREFMEVIHASDRQRVQKAIEVAIRDSTPCEEEFRLQAPGGRIRWVLARGKLENRDGHLRLPGVIVDITERRDLQAQIELARKQDQLNRQATKILHERNKELEAISRTKDEFVALASHQLRTPATAVKQYLGMVLQGYVGTISDVQAEMLAKAFESNERQIQIINQILNAARVDTGRLVLTTAPVDLNSLLQAITSDMKSMFDAHAHRLRLTLPKQPVHIMADMGYLRMAVENIMNNAIIYTPDGGTISLELRRRGKHCKILISDTGVGISKNDLNKLFVKFSRIHNPLSVQAGGSGIGLYLAAEIVRLHQGTVQAESELRKGTTFAISLPLVQNTTQ